MPSLSRVSLMPVALFAAGALSVIGYGYVTRDMGRATSATQAGHQRATSAGLLSGEPARLFQDGANAGTPGASRAEDNGSRAETDGSAAQTTSGPAAERASPNGKSAIAATPENVATWIAQATGSDAAKRAAAIEALGTAPKADAVPVLAQVLQTADDADRPRALRSLRTLAQREGDTDDRIRSVVRKIIFHADDEASTQAAQGMLDEIERDLSQKSQNKR